MFNSGHKKKRPEMVPVTLEHIALIGAIESPWASVLLATLKDEKTPNRDKWAEPFQAVTPIQLAELMFILTRAASESKELLAKGRSRFSKKAMDYLLQYVSRPMLAMMVADKGKFILDSLNTKDGGSAGTKTSA
jgi:hypothetical protein